MNHVISEYKELCNHIIRWKYTKKVLSFLSIKSGINFKHYHDPIILPLLAK